MVTGRNKNALENHFDRNWELEAALEAKGDVDRLGRVRESGRASPTCTTPGRATRAGSATPCSAPPGTSGSEPFAVLLGDDLIDPRDPLLTTMLDVRARHGGSVVALHGVPPEQIDLYGCAAVEPSPTTRTPSCVTDLVEKPPPDEAPSNLAIIGRYVLDPGVFDVLRAHRPGPGRRDPADRRAARDGGRPASTGRCTAWSSPAAATTPATGSTTSRRSSGWPASATTSGPTSRLAARAS